MADPLSGLWDSLLRYGPLPLGNLLPSLLSQSDFTLIYIHLLLNGYKTIDSPTHSTACSSFQGTDWAAEAESE